MSSNKWILHIYDTEIKDVSEVVYLMKAFTLTNGVEMKGVLIN